jgi:hypothetical protein
MPTAIPDTTNFFSGLGDCSSGWLGLNLPPPRVKAGLIERKQLPDLPIRQLVLRRV